MITPIFTDEDYMKSEMFGVIQGIYKHRTFKGVTVVCGLTRHFHSTFAAAFHGPCHCIAVYLLICNLSFFFLGLFLRNHRL